MPDLQESQRRAILSYLNAQVRVHLCAQGWVIGPGRSLGKPL